MDESTLKEGVEISKKLTRDLIKLLGFDADVKVKEKDSAAYVEINGEDLGLLIGYHGENLEALQLLLGMIVNKKLGKEEWVPVNVDIGGWREERYQALREMVQKIAADVTFEKSADLPPMSAAQRRMVHLILSEYPDLTSESVGEEPNRKVVIKKLQK